MKKEREFIEEEESRRVALNYYVSLAFNSGLKSTDVGSKRQRIGESFEEGLKVPRAPRKPRA